MDFLRQRLLDEAVGEASAEDDHGDVAQPPGPRPRHERLKEVRAKADAGEPVELSVRDLLALWGAKARVTM